MFFKSELRACQRKIYELSNELADIKGTPRMDLPHIPFNDPPASFCEGIVAISERTLKSVLLHIAIYFIMFVSGSALSVVMFVYYTKYMEGR